MVMRRQILLSDVGRSRGRRLRHRLLLSDVGRSRGLHA
jgi:hypothetical protein